MTISLDFWMACASCVVAIVACLAVAVLTPRLQSGQTVAWALVAVPSLGIALWAVHFTALLAWRLPIAPEPDIPLTLLSIEAAVVASAFVVWLGRKGHLGGVRLVAAVAALTAAVAAMRYFGIASMRLVPAAQFDYPTFLGFIAAAAAVAYAALHHAEKWLMSSSIGRRVCAAALMGTVIWAVHLVSITTARIAPSPFRPAAFTSDAVALGYGVACGTVLLLMVVCALALVHARTAQASVMTDRGFAG